MSGQAITSGANPRERFQDLITGDLIGNEGAGVLPVALIKGLCVPSHRLFPGRVKRSLTLPRPGDTIFTLSQDSFGKVSKRESGWRWRARKARNLLEFTRK